MIQLKASYLTFALFNHRKRSDGMFLLHYIRRMIFRKDNLHVANKRTKSNLFFKN